MLDLKETDPENFKEDHGPVFSNRTDLVICEISVLDSTADGSSGVKYPGKYLGLAEKGTKNKEGEATGLDYLKSLGITPSRSFLWGRMISWPVRSLSMVCELSVVIGLRSRKIWEQSRKACASSWGGGA